ncbi:hypothetical protein MASR2M41_17660 [Flammeovirgaceae bacterium]
MKGISIVLCCHNSEQRIERTLAHIKQQKKTNDIPWEVVLVDNGSTDRTTSIARELWRHEEATKLIIVTEKRLGLRYAREKGIKTARFDYIIFVDDDNWLSNEYIFKVYNNFEKNSSVALIGGLGNPVSDSLLPIWYTHYQKLYAVGKPVSQSGVLKKDSGFIYGAGMALRKSAYQNLELRGFYSLCNDRKGNQLSGGHDVELSYAFRLIDYDVMFDEQLVFAHYMDENRLTFPYLKRLSAGSAANTTTFIYHLLLNRKVESDIKFALFYFKRIIGDLIDFFIVAKGNSKNQYEDAIMKATYLSSIKYFALNFFPSLAYYRNLKTCMKDNNR